MSLLGVIICLFIVDFIGTCQGSEEAAARLILWIIGFLSVCILIAIV